MVLSAVIKTWPLEFQDIRLNIEAQFRRLRGQSAVAHQAETREIHVQISDIRNMLDQACGVSQAFGPEATTIRMNPSVMESLPFIPERVSRFLACNTFNPEQVLELAITMRDRRRARGGFIPPPVWTSQKLRDWISSPESALLQLQGSLLCAEQSRDLAIDLVQLLQVAGLPVIWYLGSTSTPKETSDVVSAVDILRSLIEQTIKQHAKATPNWNLNDSHFQACKTEKDWIRLLVAVLGHVQKMVLVIDVHHDAQGTLAIMKEFWDGMTEQGISTTVKILVLTYETPAMILDSFPVVPAAFESTGRMRNPRASLARTSARFRNPRGRIQRVGTSTRGPEDLKPFIMKLVASGKG
ncbi:hypothetical protein B0H66DRAFT_155779 [Apodospora peruviana]|uniref:Uncharacterized protein n=1 Tax=Apodospora peruviana TaxID=516989 RepID=A0AAE0IKA7_9PEZI|nr:hypothetical protein B0H66DRAFT_155779 [Apodospora peruviana]